MPAYGFPHRGGSPGWSAKPSVSQGNKGPGCDACLKSCVVSERARENVQGLDSGSTATSSSIEDERVKTKMHGLILCNFVHVLILLYVLVGDCNNK